jgi:hypothetical protein
VVLLAALIGGIALLSFGSGGNNSPTLSTLAVNRTRVVFRAPLDNTASGFVDRTGRLPGDANVRPVPGALELTAGPGGDAGRDLALPTGVVDYLLAADIAVVPGSQVKLDFGLRWSRDSRVGDLLRIDAVEGTATFARFEKGATSSQSRIIAVGDPGQGPRVVPQRRDAGVDVRPEHSVGPHVAGHRRPRCSRPGNRAHRRSRDPHRPTRVTHRAPSPRTRTARPHRAPAPEVVAEARGVSRPARRR